MKKTTLVTLVTMSAALTTFLATNTIANAAEVGSVDSQSQVQFTPQDSSTTNPPVNPLDPTQPLDPGTTNPGTTGPLSIDYVSDFDFGIQEISGETKTYNAKLDSVKVDGEDVDVPNNVQVSDNRGNNSGWHLTVAENGQLQDGTNRSLTGAQIAITKGTASTKPGTGIDAPTTASAITLNPDGTSAMVMNADADQGMGQWVDSFGANTTEAADAVQLTVPGSSEKYADTAYTTTLTWTLSDTPE
ncbi:WxL domain-containing protein [Listeria booriae]|nr:WxL domain-containing protein [Listeria booriae]MDT0111228.1 WxL domain-containing protein [Listeria booriae]